MVVWKRAHGHLVAMGGVVLEPDPVTEGLEDASSFTEKHSDCTMQDAQHEPIILTFEILQELLRRTPNSRSTSPTKRSKIKQKEISCPSRL